MEWKPSAALRAATVSACAAVKERVSSIILWAKLSSEDEVGGISEGSNSGNPNPKPLCISLCINLGSSNKFITAKEGSPSLTPHQYCLRSVFWAG